MFENWESEFLQMAVYVMLTAWLFQRGSVESKDPDSAAPQDEDPRNLLSIGLRQRGSAQSKPVHVSHRETGK